MVLARLAPYIEYLPEGMVRFIAHRLAERYMNKYANISVSGLENIDNVKSPIIFASNHLSNSDGLVLNKVLKDHDVFFVAGVKLSKNSYTNLGRYVVNTITIKPNTADKDAILSIIRVLKKGKNVLIFPEGTRSRNGAMSKGKRGIVLIQKISKARVIPVGICGSEKLMPIDKSGSMSNEGFFHADVAVKIGKPINIPVKNENEDKHSYEDRILNNIMINISKLLPEKYRGVYNLKQSS